MQISHRRADFPCLENKPGEDQKLPLVYFDNAATTQKPTAVLQAMDNYYRTSNANVHRAIHTLGERSTYLYEEARRKVQRFIGAASPEEIIFTSGTTMGINLVAHSLTRYLLKPGDCVLLSVLEHHSNIIPWQLAAREMGLRLQFIDILPDGRLDWPAVVRTWNPSIKLVALSMVSNVLGTVNPVRAIIEFAHSQGAAVLLDAAQAVPHYPVDVTELGCDFLAASGHKMCGPTGIGFLYGQKPWLQKMPPFLGGGEMVLSVSQDEATFQSSPYKFEAGTPPIAEAIGLGAAIDYLNEVGMSAIKAHGEELVRYCLAKLSSLPGIQIYGPTDERAPLVAFNLQTIHPHDLAHFLDTRGVAIRAGHHCAQPLHQRLGLIASARVSFYFYNTTAEIDYFISSLREAGDFFHAIK